MKDFLLLLLLFSFVMISMVSCASHEEMHKKNSFELHLKNPMAKNQTPAYVFFHKKEQKHRVFRDNGILEYTKRKELAKYAMTFNGWKRVKKDKKFRNDCSGFVRSVYDRFDVELYNTTKVKRKGKWLPGTEVIYHYVSEHGSVFKDRLPQTGDIIFFDNTVDRNRDGKVNDAFTHIAIVLSVDSNGTIRYIHKSNRGINIQKMNLKHRNNSYKKLGKKKVKVNSYLRKKRKKDKKHTPYLSSQMFRAFGSLFKSNHLVKK